MIDYRLARALHVLALVWWIGGVAIATSIVLPGGRKKGELEAFHDFELRFAPQARACVLVVGITGLYMLWRLNAWSWFTRAPQPWLHAMVGLWLLFFILLFILEPLGLPERFMKSKDGPAKGLMRAEPFHWVLLLLSLVTIAFGVVASP